MRVFLSLLRADLYRALLSLPFLMSIVFILLVMIISSSGFMTETADVIYVLGHALSGSGSTLFILCIAPILPYGMSFASDLEEKVPPFWIIRTGPKKYAISKLLAATIAGFLSVCLGIIIFSFIMSMFFPLFTQVSSGNSYALLLENNSPVIYILVIAIHHALSAVLFAGGAITISTFIPNKFSVIAAPIVVYFVLMRLTDLTSMPDFLKPSFIVQNIFPDVSPMAAFLYKLIPVVGVLGILLYVTVKQIQKRMGTS